MSIDWKLLATVIAGVILAHFVVAQFPALNSYESYEQEVY